MAAPCQAGAGTLALAWGFRYTRGMQSGSEPDAGAIERLRRWEARLPVGLGLVAFALYVVSAAPGLYWLDSGELTAAGFTLGVAHPPGFPLHTLLAKLFCLLPLGSVAFRVTLLSAASAAVAVGLAVALGQRLARAGGAEAPSAVRLIGGAASGCVLGLCHLFWRQATVAEVYSLGAALTLLSLWLLLGILEDGRGRGSGARDPRLVLCLALVAGLASLGAHPTYRILVLPTLGVLWLFALRRGGRHTRAVPAVFLLGGLVVLHLVAASDAGRLPDWAHATSLGALWEHVMAGRIREASFSPLMWSLRAEVVGPHLGAAWEGILAPFVGVALPLAGVGAYRLLRGGGAGDGEGRGPARTLGVALLVAGGGDFVYSVWVNPMGLVDLQNGILTVSCLAVLVGVGVASLATWIGRRSGRLAVAVASVLALISALPSALDALPEKWSGAGYGAASWVDAALAQAPSRALVLTESDDLSAGLLYAQQVEGARPDLLVLVRQHLWVAHDLRARLDADRDPALPWRELREYLGRSRQARIRDQHNLLTLLVEGARGHRPVLWEPGDGWDRGALQARLQPGVPLFPVSTEPLPPPVALVLRLQQILRGDEGDLTSRKRSHHLNALGMEYLFQRRDPQVLEVAERLFTLAGRAWPPAVAARVNQAVVTARRADLALEAGRTQEGARLLERAAALTEEALRVEPNRYAALLNAGRFRVRLAELRGPTESPASRREETRARAHFERALRLHPERAGPHFQLGVLAARQERFAAARKHFQAALARDPRSRPTRVYLERVERLIEERTPK